MNTRTMVLGLVTASLVLTLVGGCGSKVSKGNFDKISEGMTVAKVKAILGEPTDEADAGGALGGLVGSGQVLTWTDGEKSIIVTFVNDKMTTKVQKGM